MQSMIEEQFAAHRRAFELTASRLPAEIAAASELMIEALRAGNKLLLFGNGGSAADAQHIAAEFTGRFRLERRGLPAIALTTDTSALTAIGNDYGFEQIFARQVEALASPGDVLIAYSTSGNSRNVIEALRVGRMFGCHTIGLTGGDGGELRAACDVTLIVPSTDTARIQEMHLLLGHTLCHACEQALCGETTESVAPPTLRLREAA